MTAANPTGSALARPQEISCKEFTVKNAESEPIRSGSAPQIQDESGFAGEHAAAIAPSPGHGTAGDPRITRAATDALEYTEGAVPVLNPTCEAGQQRQVHGTGETGVDRPAAPISNVELEAAIAYARACLYAAPTWDEKLVRWREWVRLIDQRFPPPSSPTRIAKASVGCRGNAAGGGS